MTANDTAKRPGTVERVRRALGTFWRQRPKTTADFWCLLTGHPLAEKRSGAGRIWLYCPQCGRVSDGVTVGPVRYRRTTSGPDPAKMTWRRQRPDGPTVLVSDAALSQVCDRVFPDLDALADYLAQTVTDPTCLRPEAGRVQ